ncbi:MAG: dienelactone hydrolase family protein [Planctomycetota bacterium]|jgi:dienelactone hydrolase
MPKLLPILLLLAAVARAEVRTKTIEYKDGDTVCEGFVAWQDKVVGKRPAVLIVHQWMGLGEFEKKVAVDIATKRGCVAFAVDIYGKGVSAKNPQEAGALAGKYRGEDPTPYRSRLAAALKACIALPEVDPGRAGAIGFCFGGTGVLELARSGADVKAVVSFHGGLATSRPEDAKNIKCKVLVLHGADDPLVPDAEVAAFMKEVKAAKVDWQFVAYGGAVHAFTDPKANWKGKAEYHEDAARRSWVAMHAFFDETLR